MKKKSKKSSQACLKLRNSRTQNNPILAEISEDRGSLLTVVKALGYYLTSEDGDLLQKGACLNARNHSDLIFIRRRATILNCGSCSPGKIKPPIRYVSFYDTSWFRSAVTWKPSSQGAQRILLRKAGRLCDPQTCSSWPCNTRTYPNFIF